MTLPAELLEATRQAREAMLADPAHDLALDNVQSIWAGMGPRGNPASFPPGLGHRRRVELSTLTTRRVLPIWYAMHPYDDSPVELLSIAHAYLNGRVTRETLLPAVEQAREFFEHAVDSDSGYYPALEVLQAGRATLYLAVLDAPFDPWNLDFDLWERDEDPPALYHIEPAFAEWTELHGYLDAALFASVALEAETKPGRLRRFWEWWLDEAVPAAWCAWPQNGSG